MSTRRPPPKTFIEKEQEQAEGFRKRFLSRRKKTPSPIRDRAPRTPPRGRRAVHLVIGDSHAHSDESNYRYEALGKMVREVRPDVVIDLGDSADMSSLHGFEQGNMGPAFEGHSYWRDIDAYRDARERFHHYARSSHRPRLVRLYGNHEDRITRAISATPTISGAISLQDLGDDDFGWQCVPFLEPISIDEVVYSHYFKARGSVRAVGGVMPARAVLMKYPGSQLKVFGHTHSFGFFEQADGAPETPMSKISVINAGCYFDPTMPGMKWSRTDINNWRAGILVIEVEGGQLKSWKWTDYWDVQRQWGK